MGVLFFVMWLAAVLAILTAMIVYWIVNHLVRAKWAVVLSAVIGLLIFCTSFGPVFEWVKTATTTIVVGASADAADQVMEFYGMPSGTASDFSFRRSCGGTPLLADFLMKQEDYLDWMRARSRTPMKITEDGTAVFVCPVRDYELGKELQVTRGWCYYFAKPDNPDCTEQCVWNADNGRVYFRLTSW